MIRIRLQYDAERRTFELIDKEFGSILEDGAVYNMRVRVTLQEEGDIGDIEELLSIRDAPVAHA